MLASFSLVILNFVAFKTRNECSGKTDNLAYKHNFIKQYPVDAFPNVSGSLCHCSRPGDKGN